jgi:ribonuclease HI
MNKVAQTLSAMCLLFFANQAHGQWAPTGGPESASVGELVVSGDAVFARTGEGVYRLTNDGASWTAVDNGLTDLQIYALAAHGDTIFAGTEDMNGVGQIYRSTNNGASWTVVNNGLIDRRIHALAARGDTIFAGAVDKNGVGQVYRSTNNGSSWTEVNSGLPNMIVFYAFALSGRAIFAGTLEDGVYRSVNSGVSWTAVNSGLTDHEIVSFAVNNDTIFAGAASGVYRSTNNGALWTAVNNGLTDKLVTALAVSGNNIFAGSKSCVYLSTNNGASWTAVNTGLPNADSNAVMTITALAVCGGSLYVGVGGNGVWRRPLSEMLTASPALPQTIRSALFKIKFSSALREMRRPVLTCAIVLLRTDS